MALKPIEILRDTISSVAHRITISSVVSLGSNQYQLNTANTLYLRTDKRVTIDSIEYKVVDFDINSYITVAAIDGTDQPVSVSFFDINAPLFLFGSPKLVSGELIKRIKNKTDFSDVWPYMWIVEISNTKGSLSPSAAIKATPSFNIFFLDSNNKNNWTIQQHYDLDVYVMMNYIEFVLTILKSRRDIYDADSIDYETTNHVNFGDYVVDKGNNEKILNDNVTGVQLNIDLPIINLGCGDITVEANCPIITETFNGSTIESPTPSKAIIVQSDASGNPQVGTKTTDTPTSLIITVPAQGAGDPSANQVNGAAKTDIPSGGSKDFQIEYANGDPVIVTEVSDSATVFNGTVPDLPSGVTSNILGTGQENSYRPRDDGGRFLNGDYASVNLSDVTDYYTLSAVNEWGSLKRFTGDNGGYMDEATGNFFDVNDVATTKAGAFPNDIMRDYATRRRWFLGRSGVRTWNDAIDLSQTDSKGGETGWYLPNKAEYETISSNSDKSVEYIDSRLFNWPAFNMWSSTTDKTNTTNAHRMSSGTDAWATATKAQTNGGAYIKLF